MSNNYRNSEISLLETLEDILSDEERSIRIFATQMLKSRMFLGHFQERRRVEALKTYRDVIVVNESEIDLIKDLEVVDFKLREFYDGTDHWIGLTDPRNAGAPNGHCIWVESQDNAFGMYWYKIRGVRFRLNETVIKLKVIRPVTETEARQKQLIQSNLATFFANFSWETAFESTKNTILENLIWFFTTVLTVQNIKAAVQFLSVLLAAGVTLVAQGIPLFMNFALRFMHECSYFIQSSTPVMISIVNLFGKIIGGFYLLIAMIWRDSKKPKPNAQMQQLNATSIRYRPKYRAIEPAGGATITEIN